jgi:hypothetical protein
MCCHGQSVQQRDANIVNTRHLSSAMSTAKATCDHMRDWWQGTNDASHNYCIDHALLFIRVSFDLESMGFNGRH